MTLLVWIILLFVARFTW